MKKKPVLKFDIQANGLWAPGACSHEPKLSWWRPVRWSWCVTDPRKADRLWVYTLWGAFHVDFASR